MLPIYILTAGCTVGEPTTRNTTEEDTLGMVILINGLKNGANTLIIVTKEKRENVLTSGVV